MKSAVIFVWGMCAAVRIGKIISMQQQASQGGFRSGTVLLCNIFIFFRYCAARCRVTGFLSVSGDGIFFDSLVWTGARNLWAPFCLKFVIVTACFYKVFKK